MTNEERAEDLARWPDRRVMFRDAIKGTLIAKGGEPYIAEEIDDPGMIWLRTEVYPRIGRWIQQITRSLSKSRLAY